MLTILDGDALGRLRELPEESIQCCVSSPPYWGLRDYSAEGQFGLEKTSEEYVARMVEIFMEVRRVLRKDGTLWLNLGDSYAGGGNYRGVNEETLSDKQRSNRASHGLNQRCGIVDIPNGLKPKDLCGIPWRVAFALQSDGWWLRSDIIWAKPNPMPESVTDRPTKSHEYLFLMTKSSTYFYDAEAIKEKVISENPISSAEYRASINRGGNNRGLGNFDNGTTQKPMGNPESGNRNKRSVWTVATAPYPEAHFATYPPDLIKPCVMAGTSAKGCCGRCGAPWERIVKASGGSLGKGGWHKHEDDLGRGQHGAWPTTDYKVETLGWQPTCKCEATTVPCTVLDPFAGSGTTGMVALELGRKAILIELNPAYCKLIEERCNVTPGLALA